MCIRDRCVVDASIAGRDDERLTVDHETNVTDETFVENVIHGFAIIVTALWETFQCCAIRLRECHVVNSKW